MTSCAWPRPCRASRWAIRRPISPPRWRWRASRRATGGAGRLPRAQPLGLRDRRSAVTGRAAGGGRSRYRQARRGVAGSSTRCWSSARRCATAGGLYNTAVVIHRGRILGVVPKTYLPNYREFYEKRHFTAGAGVRGETHRGRRRRASPFGVDLLFAGDRRHRRAPSMLRSARTSGRRSRPPAARRWPGARSWSTSRPATSPSARPTTRRLLCAAQSARGIAAYLYTAAGPGESTTDLAWDGQAEVFENGALLAASERFVSRRADLWPTSISGRLRAERMRVNSFGDNAPPNCAPTGRSAPCRSPSTRPAEPVRLRREVERFPYVPADPARLAQDCYEAYNIQVEGAGHAAEGDRLEDAGDRRLRRPGLDPRADRLRPRAGPAGPPAQPTSSPTPCRASPPPRHQVQRLGADEGHRRHRRRDRHPPRRPPDAGRHRPPVRARRAGVRRHLRERAGGPAHRLSVPPRQPPPGPGGRHRRPVGTGAGLVHLRRRRPDEPLQRQRLGAEDADPAPDPVRGRDPATWTTATADCCRPSWAPKSRRSSCRPDAAGAIQSTEAIVGPYALQDFNLYYTLRYGFPPSKVAYPRAARLGRRRAPATGRRTSPTPRVAPTRCPRSSVARGVPEALLRLQPVQALGVAERAEDLLRRLAQSPRGDWRAPSDGNAAVWLAELAANVPDE